MLEEAGFFLCLRPLIWEQRVTLSWLIKTKALRMNKVQVLGGRGSYVTIEEYGPSSSRKWLLLEEYASCTSGEIYFWNKV